MAEFIERLGASQKLPVSSKVEDYYSDLIKQILTVDLITRGRVTCSFRVLPRISNYYNGLHGGAVAAIAERVAIACARTIVADDKPLFLGELSISYLSAFPINAALMVDGSMVRSGRNLSVVSIEFKQKGSGKLGYTAQATLFHTTPSKL